MDLGVASGTITNPLPVDTFEGNGPRESEGAQGTQNDGAEGDNGRETIQNDGVLLFFASNVVER